MRLGKAIYVLCRPSSFHDGKWHYETQEIEVRIMAMAEGWAMVRTKRCVPFVCKITDLRQEVA